MDAQKQYETFLEALVTKKLVIFGTSVASFRAVNTYLINEDVYFYSDNDEKKWGSSFIGRKVCPPKQIIEEKDNVVVLIASVYAKDIKKQLIEMGYTAEIFTTEILVFKIKHSMYLHYNAHKFIVPNYMEYCYTDGSPYKNSIVEINENIDKINQVTKYFSDEKSVFVYENIIKNRKYNYFDYSNIMETIPNMYFVEGLLTFGNDEVFVDAGVFDGQTSLEFIRTVNNEYERVYAFEPDTLSYESALLTLGGQINDGKVQLIKKGLYNEEKSLNFNNIGDVRSSITQDGNTSIEVVKLDDTIEGKVTFIKMDIEGAEIEAILGAKEKITKYKPKLAISVYHKISHLWEIPLLVKSLVPEYKLYIRQHTSNPDETVLYATL